MWKIDYRFVFIAAALLTVRPAAAVPDPTPASETARENAELRQRVRTLEDRVNSLERQLEALRRQQPDHGLRIIPAPQAPAQPEPELRIIPTPEQPRRHPSPYFDRRNWQERNHNGIRFYIIPLEQTRLEPK